MINKENNKTKRIITWLKPTWDQLHLWNLLWAVLPFKTIAEQENIDAAIFVADVHALNWTKDWKLLKERTKEILIEYFSVYWLDTKVKIFIESEITWLYKLSSLLNNFTPYSLMLRAHAFKDAENNWTDLNMWVFNYPILMAADIIWYDIDLVPVWKDQAQHLEMTRDIARNINKEYKKEILKVPETYIKEDVWVIPWLDWRKMSKSYDNFIWLFDDDKTLKKKIMSIPTDSLWLEDVKNPDTCNVFALIKLFWTKDEIEEIRAKYLAWNYWYWHAKLALLDILIRYLNKYRESRKYIEANMDLVYEKVEKDTKIMNKRMNIVLERIKKHIWI